MSDNKKALIYTGQILKRTDARHPITAGRICDILENEYGIITERRTVGRNIKTLMDAGMKIKYCKDNRLGCYLAERTFSDVELKLLLDSVDKSEILSKSEEEQLKTKILSLASESMKKILSDATRGGASSKRSEKNGENSVLDTMKLIINCMEERKRLSFMYGDRDRKLQLKPRRGGAVYTVDPYALTQMDGRYYLVCRYSDMQGLSYYRLDRMMQPQISEEAITNPKELLGENWRERIADFIEGSVRNYGGSKKTIIVLRAAASMIGYMYDEFGTNILRTQEVKSEQEKLLDIYISTAENDGLYYLLFQYGSNIQVMSPEHIREKYVNMLQKMISKYDKMGYIE